MKIHPMKRCFTLIAFTVFLLFSCKTSEIGSSRSDLADEVKVKDNGYIYGYAPAEKITTPEKDPAKQPPAFISQIVNTNASIAIKQTLFVYPSQAKKEIGLSGFPEEKIMLYALSLKKYALENGYDTSYAFLANMGQLSCTKRLYLVDLTTFRVISKGLVSHGRGKGKTLYTRQYSNDPGSNSTALGKYKVTVPYNGQYGYSYKMVGLDESNSNAARRNIVLHSMSCIPDKENYAPACVSEGCPAISKQYLNEVKPIIEKCNRPMLFWIFDSLLQEAVIENPVKKNEILAIAKNN